MYSSPPEGAHRPASTPRRPRWLTLLPYSVLLLGLATTLLAFVVFDRTFHARSHETFTRRAEDIARHIEERLQGDAQLLRTTAGFFQVVGNVTRAEWQTYVAPLRLSEHAPGIQGLGFAEWIPAEALPAHLERLRAEGFGNYEVRPPGERPIYTSIIYLEPFDARNRRAFGYDMYAEATRRAAMDQAIESVDIALSRRVELVQETGVDPQAGSLMYLPVFRGAAPADPLQRRAALRGFVYSPIRLKDLVHAALAGLPTEVAFELYTSPTPDPAERVYASHPEVSFDPPGETPEYAHTTPVRTFGASWSITAHALPGFAAGANRVAARWLVAGGLLISGALFAATLAFARRRAHALVLAAVRTESEARFRSFFELPIVGAALSSPDKGWLAVNDRLCAMLGRRREDFIGRAWTEFTHPDDLSADIEQFERILARAQDGYTLEKRFLRPAGPPLWVRLAVQCVRDAEGNPQYFAALIDDLTERKRAERILDARVALMDYALTHTLHEVLVHSLDLVEGLTDSLIGFYHFVDADQQSLTLQAWSTRTARDYCRAEGHGSHYPVEQAGVWVDCIREGRPVIHDDYAALTHKKGLPPGHAPVLRELVVPVTRSGRIVAVIGVGNKATSYDDEDLDTVTRFADLAWDIAERSMVLAERTAAMERARESDARFAIAFERAPVMMMLSRLEDGTFLEVNDAFLVAAGFTREETIGHTSVEIGWLDVETRRRIVGFISTEGRVDGLEITLHAKGGRSVIARYWGTEVTIGGERRIFSIVQDMTAERALHHQLEQSQKLESIGRLAGGVAHDFNNMLSVIRGYTELLLQSAEPETPLHDDLEEIRRAAERSAAITRQLLAFARKQVVEPRVLDLNETVAGMLKMLRRLLGEDIDLTWTPGASLHRVRVDPAQIDQILANLCVNARDAIEGVGRIDISTGNVTLDAAYCAGRDDVTPGNYVRLTVHDSGSGIAPEVLTHIFEPFFTTKEVGQGTGLGLATVYGIVHQNHGSVDAESPPGSGAVFHIHLPAVEVKPATAASGTGPLRGPLGQGETVLLAEDEPAVLRLCEQFLRRLGYRVLPANSAEEAERLAVEHAAEIRLLMTDLVMPGMSGEALAARISARVPGIRCLFMSGYSPETVGGHGVRGRMTFIQKPFDLKTLAARVRAALEGDAGVGR